MVRGKEAQDSQTQSGNDEACPAYHWLLTRAHFDRTFAGHSYIGLRNGAMSFTDPKSATVLATFPSLGAPLSAHPRPSPEWSTGADGIGAGNALFISLRRGAFNRRWFAFDFFCFLLCAWWIDEAALIGGDGFSEELAGTAEGAETDEVANVLSVVVA